MIKNILLFPLRGIYNYAIRMNEDYRISDEIALILRLEVIYIVLFAILKPQYVLILMFANLLNIPIALYIGGSNPVKKTVSTVKDIDYDSTYVENSGDGNVKIGLEDDRDLIEEVEVNKDPYFDEDESILNKTSSILRYTLIDGLKSFIKDPKGKIGSGLSTLFKEDDIEFLGEDEEVIAAKVEEVKEEYANQGIDLDDETDEDPFEDSQKELFQNSTYNMQNVDVSKRYQPGVVEDLEMDISDTEYPMEFDYYDDTQEEKYQEEDEEESNENPMGGLF